MTPDSRPDPRKPALWGPYIVLEVLEALVLLGAMALALLLPHGGKETDAMLGRAETLYSEGIALAGRDDDGARLRFAESAAVLDEVLEHTDSAGVHFNRGNALLQAGEVGEAIAALHAAAARAPGDARIDANLAEARARVSRSIGVPAPTTIERICESWSWVGERTRWIGAIGLVLLAVVLRRLATTGRSTRTPALAAAVLALLLLCSVGLDLLRRTTASYAVTTAPSVLRKGNGDGFEQVVAEPLPEGTECRSLEARPGWTEVELSGGTRGWLKSADLTMVR